jgi:hypothetical protein
MLGHAMRHELAALADTIQSVGNETFLGTVPLCLLASAYVAIDVSGMRWPNDVVLRKIAGNASKSATGRRNRRAHQSRRPSRPHAPRPQTANLPEGSHFIRRQHVQLGES